MRDLLGRVELLSDLGAEDLDRISGSLRQHSFRAGERIIEEGRPSDRFYILLSGSVRVTATLTDQKDFYAILNAGDHFGEISLIDGQAPSATVIAEEDCTAVSLGRDDLLDLLNSEPRLAATILMSMLRAFCRRLRETDQTLSFTRLMMREKGS